MFGGGGYVSVKVKEGRRRNFVEVGGRSAGNRERERRVSTVGWGQH